MNSGHLKSSFWLPAVTSLILVSCNLTSSKAPGRGTGSAKTDGKTEETTDTQALRVNSLAINFSENLAAQGLSEGQVSVISNSARTEMSAIYTNSLVISQTTSMALQQTTPEISELMGALSRGATKAIAEEAAQAMDKDAKIVVAKSIIKAALSTIKSNAESSSSDVNMTSSLEEIVAEMTKSLSLAGIADDDLHDVTGAVSGEAIANVSLAGFPSSAIETTLPKIVESTARGIANANYSEDLVPAVLGEATKVMMTRLKDLNISGSSVTTVSGKFSEAAIAGVIRSSRGQTVLPGVAGSIASGTISSLIDHGFSKEEIREASTKITTKVVKAAAARTTDATKVANIQDITITKAVAGLQNTGFSESEVDLLKQDLSSSAVQAAAESAATPITNQVVFQRTSQVSWLAIKDGQTDGSWQTINLTDATKCDNSTCKIPINSADKTYVMAYACENPINVGIDPPYFSDPSFFQRNNFDPMWPSKRVNVSVIYDKIIGNIAGQSPNCNDLFTPTADSTATTPIYQGPSRPLLVPVNITVSAGNDDPICQIGRTPFACGTKTTIALPQGKGVKILVGSGVGSSDLAGTSRIGNLEVPSKVKLFTLDIEQNKSYSLIMDDAMVPVPVSLEINELTAGRTVYLSNTVSVSSNGSTFSVSLDMTTQRFVPEGSRETRYIYNLPSAANRLGAVITLTGSSSTQVSYSSGQATSSGWRSKAFTKKILPSDTLSSMAVQMLPDIDSTKVTLTNGTNTALPLNWQSTLDSTSSSIRRLNLTQLTPASNLVYTIYAPPSAIAGNATLSVPSELKSLSGWQSHWNISKVLNSFWTSSISSPIGTDGASYLMSSDRILPVTSDPETRTVTCSGSQPSGDQLQFGPANVTQNLSLNGWAPASFWRYTSNTTPSSCEFKCASGYNWNLRACVPVAGSVTVRIAESLPPTTNNQMSQLISTSANVCSIVASFTSPATYRCLDGASWVSQATFTDPRPSVPLTSTAISGIPVYLQEVGGVLTGVYTDSDGVRFASLDAGTNKWTRTVAPLPQTITGDTLQFAKILGSGANLYTAYAWQPAGANYWQAMIAKSADSGRSWTKLPLPSSLVKPFTAHFAWDDLANPTKIYLKYSDTLATTTTKILQVSISGGTATILDAASPTLEPNATITYWNNKLWSIKADGKLLSLSYSSSVWTATDATSSLVLPNSRTAQFSSDGTNLDIFAFDFVNKQWKHSRLTTSMGAPNPDNEIVAFAQRFYESSDKRPFVNSVSGITYFNFYDGTWKRVAFSSGRVQAPERNITMVNPEFSTPGSTKAAGLFVDNSNVYRFTSLTDDLYLSALQSGNTWPTAARWNVNTYQPSMYMGKMTRVAPNRLAYLDCKEGNPLIQKITVVNTSQTPYSSISVSTAETCASDPRMNDQMELVANSNATAGKPNLFSLGFEISNSTINLFARRFIYDGTNITIPSSGPKVNLAIRTSQATIKQSLYAADKLHALICDPNGNIQTYTWHNPTFASLELPSITTFIPSSPAGCPAASMTADGSGNISLKLIDEEVALFSSSRGTWVNNSNYTSRSLAVYNTLRGGNIFMRNLNTYCKLSEMGTSSSGTGTQSLVLLCVAKSTEAVPNPPVTQYMIDDTDFGGGLISSSMAVVNDQIHVVYPSLYKPNTYRQAIIP